MSDRPLIMQPESVRGIIAGRKTMTRRVLKPQPWPDHHGKLCVSHPNDMVRSFVPPYQPGQLLWVRETHCIDYEHGENTRGSVPPAVYCRADESGKTPWREGHEPWRSPIHMPRWASRLTLEVIAVKVERLQDISEEDAEAEGWPAPEDRAKSGIAEIRDAYPIGWFGCLWDRINKKPGTRWKDNPWIAAISFVAHHQNIDDLKARAA